MKCYGSDMFSIPKMLHEMDPARVDTFRSIYGKHLGVATRHIEDLRQIETELFSKHWSTDFEEAIIPQLPWPEDKFELYSPPEKVGRESPFSLIGTLAVIVAIRQGDFSLLPRNGPGLVSSGRPDIALEAALQFANWRVAGNTYLESLRYAAMDILRECKEKTMLVRLSQAYLGEDGVTAPEESLDSDDPEISFFGALLLKHEPLLIPALDSTNPLKRMVAADKLIRMHKGAAVVDLYTRRCDPEQQLSLLKELHLAKKAVPECHPVLFATIARYPKTELSEYAAGVLCFGCTHAEAIRLAELKDWRILHALSLAKLDPETFRAIGEMLVSENMVTMGEYAWGCMAKDGRMPRDFVEHAFPFARSPETEAQLLAFAEKQLDDLPGIPKGTSMERVLIHAAFGYHEPQVIGAAWAGLHRINMHREVGGPTPFPLSTAAEFWPLPEFEDRLKKLQANNAAMAQTFVADDLRRFLGSRVRD